MTKIISISMTDADKCLLDDMELSPSGLFKQKMQEIRDNSFNYQTKLNRLIAANSELTKLLFEEQERNGSYNKNCTPINLPKSYVGP